MVTTVIANPKAGGGRTAKRLPDVTAKLEAALGPLDVQLTAAPMHAVELTRAALKQGSTLIIAVGGDGTINECVNGFFENGTAIAPDAELGLLNSGTGGDFRRTFEMGPELETYVEALTAGTAKRIDLARVTYQNWQDEEEQRYFDNISSFGLSGVVDANVNKARFSKLFGGTFSFYWATLTAMMGFTPQACRIQVDDHFDEVVNVNNAAVCNGQFFGGGMWIAPMADPSDGMLEVVIIKDARFLDMLKESGNLYDGSHLENPRVVTTRGKRVIAMPVNQEDVLMDVDGETPGKLPATFEVIPAAINLRCKTG